MLTIENPYAPIEEIYLKETVGSNIRLFIKREDLSHPFISGNKWRKLKYHLLTAKELDKKKLVTFGGPYSNHLLATAAAGAKYGFETFGFVRGEPVKNPILELCKLFGMTLEFVSRTDYQDKEQLFEKHFTRETNIHLIPEGGGGTLGEKGVSEIFDPIGFQTSLSKENQLIKFNQIFTAVGTGSTMRGLLDGAINYGVSTIIHGVVVLKGAEAMASQFGDYEDNKYELHHRFHFGGYAKTTPDLLDFIKKFASQTGILLDQVYEAKMVLGLVTLIQEGYFPQHSNILAIHNGGQVGLLGLISN